MTNFAIAMFKCAVEYTSRLSAARTDEQNAYEYRYLTQDFLACWQF